MQLKKESPSVPARLVNTGLITAAGRDTADCLKSLISGTPGISFARHLNSARRDEFPVGEVKYSNTELAEIAGVPAHWPRTALLSAVAVREVLSPFSGKLEGWRTGFFSANTVGGMDLTEQFYPQFLADNAGGDISRVKAHECGAVTELVAGHFGITGFVTTISTACSSSANSIMMAAQMIRAGILDIAVAGGADALSRFTLNGFNSLMILDREPCRPFDATRKGLNLGEGAGYVLLMSDSAAAATGAQTICTLSGYANANDAYHQTASSPDGKGNVLAMQQALQQAGLSPEAISYINLHGTGTANNDSSEGRAVSAVFGDRIPYASSTKAFTGHTLGAAGGVEAVFSALSIREQIVFPNLRWQNRMEEVDWEPATELVPNADIRHVLSNSFGFGGNCSSLIFSKQDS